MFICASNICTLPAVIKKISFAIAFILYNEISYLISALYFIALTVSIESLENNENLDMNFVSKTCINWLKVSLLI